MSRTDKDQPEWYGEYYQPFHRCRNGQGFYYRGRDCDLPELRWDTVRPVRPVRRFCEWRPVKPPGTKKWYYCTPGWWFHQVWLEPERARVRDECHSAMQDYHANGNTDIDVADYRKKHNGGWYW